MSHTAAMYSMVRIEKEKKKVENSVWPSEVRWTKGVTFDLFWESKDGQYTQNSFCLQKYKLFYSIKKKKQTSLFVA
jgi:hypothetical protein